PLRRLLSGWTEKKAGELKIAEPEMPESLNDRQQDGAECLLAIADAAGGDWPERVRKAFVVIYSRSCADDRSKRDKLLADNKWIFEERDRDRLQSGDLIAGLIAIETSPWSEWNKGKPMSPVSLARTLTAFEIAPRTIRLDDGSTAKGYLREFFEDAWTRFLPS